MRRWKVFNGGLGPAIIQEMVLFVNDQSGQGPISKDDHWKALSSLRSVKHTINWGKLLVPGESFQAGAEIEPFSLRWNDVRTMEAVDIETLPVLAICYCSFYEKCTYKDSRPYSDNPTKPLMNCPETQKNPSKPPRKGLKN